MDAKRLEELAVWATTEANALDYEGSERASGRLRDLAHCAKEYGQQIWRCWGLWYKQRWFAGISIVRKGEDWTL